MITREKLEQQQIWLYVAALIMGGFLGLVSPTFGSSLHITISPTLAVPFYGMFAQIPFLQLRESMSNKRFIGALLLANFVIVSIVVWLLTRWFPQSPPILVRVYLVLLSPALTM